MNPSSYLSLPKRFVVSSTDFEATRIDDRGLSLSDLGRSLSYFDSIVESSLKKVNARRLNRYALAPLPSRVLRSRTQFTASRTEAIRCPLTTSDSLCARLRR